MYRDATSGEGDEADRSCKTAAAKVFGLKKLQVNALPKGKMDLFNLDALVMVAASAGLTVRLLVKNGGVI